MTLKPFLATISAIGMLGFGGLSGYVFWKDAQIPKLEGTQILSDLNTMIAGFNTERPLGEIFDYASGEITEFSRQNPYYITQLDEIQGHITEVGVNNAKSTYPTFNAKALEYLTSEISAIPTLDNRKDGNATGGVASAAACLTCGYFFVATLVKKEGQ